MTENKKSVIIDTNGNKGFENIKVITIYEEDGRALLIRLFLGDDGNIKGIARDGVGLYLGY